MASAAVTLLSVCLSASPGSEFALSLAPADSARLLDELPLASLVGEEAPSTPTYLAHPARPGNTMVPRAWREVEEAVEDLGEDAPDRRGEAEDLGSLLAALRPPRVSLGEGIGSDQPRSILDERILGTRVGNCLFSFFQSSPPLLSVLSVVKEREGRRAGSACACASATKLSERGNFRSLPSRWHKHTVIEKNARTLYFNFNFKILTVGS